MQMSLFYGSLNVCTFSLLTRCKSLGKNSRYFVDFLWYQVKVNEEIVTEFEGLVVLLSLEKLAEL